MSRYNAARVRFWAAQLSEQGNRGRVRLVLLWTSPGAAARVLAEVRGHRQTYHAMREREGLNVGTQAWRQAERHRALVSARDRLYHLRQARDAGVIRCRVPS